MASNTTTAQLTRRRLLQLAGLGGTASLFYAYQRGIRFPRLSLESAYPRSEFAYEELDTKVNYLISTPTSDKQADYSYRAYAPEPSLALFAKSDQILKITVNNIANDADLSVIGAAKSQIRELNQGITRFLEISLKRNQTITLSWQLPKLQDYTFASIGDSGGDKELGWCIERAHKLGARFLLHLGDFNYQQGDYDNAIKQFANAPLPCYITIGNHDFHESGLIYQQFLNELGPLSYHFTIGKTRFANIDTAANTLPYHAGHRGQLFKELSTMPGVFSDTVAFTHRPLHDPLGTLDQNQDDDHDIGSIGERDWLIKSLKNVNAKTLLSGHIHIYHRSDFHGIDNIIAGQGLGHQDLMVNSDQSKMVVGQVDQNGKVTYVTAPLAMPMELHCHPRSDVVKKSMLNSAHADVIRAIDEGCET